MTPELERQPLTQFTHAPLAGNERSLGVSRNRAGTMADEGEKWECPVCMFENLPTNRGTCEFCGEAMPPRNDAVEEAPAPPPAPVDPPVEDDPVEEPPLAPSTGDELAQLLEEFEAAAGLGLILDRAVAGLRRV